VWLRRFDLAAAPKRISRAGLALVALALALHWMGARSQQTRLSLLALVLLIWALPFYLYGWAVARPLIFPASLLIFCVPLNFLDSLTFPMRLLSATLAAGLLNGLGVGVHRTGSALVSVLPGSFGFDGSDPSSGLAVLLGLAALAALLAYSLRLSLGQKWLLFAAAAPALVAGNMLRLLLVCLLAEIFSLETGDAVYHHASTPLVFLFSALALLTALALLRLNYRDLWKKMLERRGYAPTSSSAR
jgi:exosortase